MILKETEAEIVRLHHAENWPIGTIAHQLGLHHTTVQRVLHQAGVASKVVAPRPSMVDPFVPFVVEQLEKYPALRASRLFEMVIVVRVVEAQMLFIETHPGIAKSLLADPPVGRIRVGRSPRGGAVLVHAEMSRPDPGWELHSGEADHGTLVVSWTPQILGNSNGMERAEPSDEGLLRGT